MVRVFRCTQGNWYWATDASDPVGPFDEADEAEDAVRNNLEFLFEAARIFLEEEELELYEMALGVALDFAKELGWTAGADSQFVRWLLIHQPGLGSNATLRERLFVTWHRARAHAEQLVIDSE
jgi:hypothetical protein